MFSRKSFSPKSFSPKSWWMGVVEAVVKAIRGVRVKVRTLSALAASEIATAYARTREASVRFTMKRSK